MAKNDKTPSIPETDGPVIPQDSNTPQIPVDATGQTPGVAEGVIPADDEATGTTEATGENGKRKRNKPAEEVKILGVNTTLQMPTEFPRKQRAGKAAKYDFDKLEVGQSIGVANRNAQQLTSTVSTANRRYLEPVLGEDGAPTYEMVETKDAAGNVTGKVPNRDKPITRATKEFKVVDCDPKTDPEQATARIWRIA